MAGCACGVWAIITALICWAISVGCQGNRNWADKQPGNISPDFRREIITARRDFRRQLELYNLFYYNEEGIKWSICDFDLYWTELGQAVISRDAEKVIFENGFEVFNMHLEAVDKVINDPILMQTFNIPEGLWPAINASW